MEGVVTPETTPVATPLEGVVIFFAYDSPDCIESYSKLFQFVFRSCAPDTNYVLYLRINYAIVEHAQSFLSSKRS